MRFLQTTESATDLSTQLAEQHSSAEPSLEEMRKEVRKHLDEVKVDIGLQRSPGKIFLHESWNKFTKAVQPSILHPNLLHKLVMKQLFGALP